MKPTRYMFKYAPYGPWFRMWTDGKRYEARKEGYNYDLTPD